MINGNVGIAVTWGVGSPGARASSGSVAVRCILPIPAKILSYATFCLCPEADARTQRARIRVDLALTATQAADTHLRDAVNGGGAAEVELRVRNASTN